MGKYSYIFKNDFLIKGAIIYILVVLACKVVGGLGFALVTAPLVFFAIQRNRSEWLFFWLLMMAVMITSNGKILMFDSRFAMSQRVMMMLLAVVMTLKMFGQGMHPYLKPLTGIMVYISYMAVTSLAGWCPLISYLKIILFVFVWMGFCAICNRVMMEERDRIVLIRGSMLLFACWVLFGSVAILPFPGLSQMSMWEMDEMSMLERMQSLSLFQGMCRHSQLLGPVCAAIGTLVLGDYLYSVRQNNWIYNALLFCCVLCIWKTSSRTALASFMIGVLCVMYFFMRSRGFSARWKSHVLNLFFAGALLALGAILVVPAARERALGFLFKYSGAAVSMKQIEFADILASRRGKLDECIYNWKQSPLVGNGFQVSENMKGITLARGGLSVLSAPVEKSTWMYAILEEGGVLGLAIFCIYCLIVWFALSRRRAYIGLSCFVVQLAINVGEFGMFSLSYIGAITWACVFAGCVMDSQRYKYQQILDFDKRMRDEAAEARLAGWLGV